MFRVIAVKVDNSFDKKVAETRMFSFYTSPIKTLIHSVILFARKAPRIPLHTFMFHDL
jgi:hypothetical protein